MNKFFTLIKNYLPFTVGIVLLYFLFTITKIGCPIKYITGIPCLGCGMTRATLSILKLDFDMAFYYHPMIFVLLPTVIAYFVSFILNRAKSNIWKIIFYTVCVLFVVCYFIRIKGNIGVLSNFSVTDGLIYKAVSYIIKR